MPGAGQNLTTIAKVNDLLGKICPAMLKPRAAQHVASGLPVIDEVTFVALHLVEQKGGKQLLSLSRGKMALSADTKHLVPGGEYQLHMFDTSVEVLAALRLLEAVGNVDAIGRQELPGGEGALLIRVARSPKTQADSDHDEAEREGSGQMLRFAGADGLVTFTIFDNRHDMAHDGGAYTPRRSVVSSLSYPRADVCRMLNNEQPQPADALRRGRLIARIVEMSCRTPAALRFCQHSLESITGALVSTSSVSVAHVVDQLEEMLEGLEEDLLPPKAEDMHDLIVNHARNQGPDPEDIARDVAWHALRGNMTRRA